MIIASHEFCESFPCHMGIFNLRRNQRYVLISINLAELIYRKLSE